MIPARLTTIEAHVSADKGYRIVQRPRMSGPSRHRIDGMAGRCPSVGHRVIWSWRPQSFGLDPPRLTVGFQRISRNLFNAWYGASLTNRLVPDVHVKEDW